MKADIKWLDDPQVFYAGRLPAHSDHEFYASKEEYQNGKSSFMKTLDGEWRFCFSKNAKERPAEFYLEEFDHSNFDKIKVPGHIELAGYDKIHYINTMYPWEGKIYRRPAYSLENKDGFPGMFSQAEYNPVGSYLKEFDLEQYGGAPMLGLKGLVVKTHGSSKANEIKNSILQCIAFSEQKINEKIKEKLGTEELIVDEAK